MKAPAGVIRMELAAFAFLILAANLPLFTGAMATQFVFMPDRVIAGEWWRVLTHPFIHVSWYHLLLDAAAFLLLYAEFPNWTLARRLGVVAACGAGSLIAALTSPLVSQIGLCGLSGIAHGLTAVAALQMIRHGERVERTLGITLLLGLIGKTVFETITGQAMLSLLHFGSVGIPITACHAGGVLAGLVFGGVEGRLNRGRTGINANSSSEKGRDDRGVQHVLKPV